MKSIIIKDLKFNNAITIIRNVSKNNISKVIEKWQKSTIYAQLHNRLNPYSYVVSDESNFVKLLIESKKL